MSVTTKIVGGVFATNEIVNWNLTSRSEKQLQDGNATSCITTHTHLLLSTSIFKHNQTHMYTDFPSDRPTGRSILTDRNFYTTIWMLLPPTYNQKPKANHLLPSSSELSLSLSFTIARNDPRLYQKFVFSKQEEPLKTSTNSRMLLSSSLLHRHSTRRNQRTSLTLWDLRPLLQNS